MQQMSTRYTIVSLCDLHWMRLQGLCVLNENLNNRNTHAGGDGTDVGQILQIYTKYVIYPPPPPPPPMSVQCCCLSLSLSLSVSPSQSLCLSTSVCLFPPPPPPPHTHTPVSLTSHQHKCLQCLRTTKHKKAFIQLLVSEGFIVARRRQKYRKRFQEKL